MSNPDLTLYYDGLCPLCSREIAFFRRRTAGDPSVRYVDIAEAAFDAAGHGLDPVRVRRWMHVKLGEEVKVGLDAFIAVWGRVRGFGWLARLARLPGLYRLFRLGYALFALVRPLLPRRRAGCDTGACRR
jgi:predicted DCC family thiol-disulfide oxidoreductase YuxK